MVYAGIGAHAGPGVTYTYFLNDDPNFVLTQQQWAHFVYFLLDAASVRLHTRTLHQVSPEVQMTVLVSVIFRVLPAQPGLGVSSAPCAAHSTAHR